MTEMNGVKKKKEKKETNLGRYFYRDTWLKKGHFIIRLQLDYDVYSYKAIWSHFDVIKLILVSENRGLAIVLTLGSHRL